VALLQVSGAVLVLAAIAAEIAGGTWLRAGWWGVDAWAFLPKPAFALGLALVAAGLLAAWRAPAALDRRLAGLLGGAPPLPGWAGRALAGALAGVVFWIFREGHTLLGDGNALVRNIPAGQSFHPDEPLAVWLHHVFYGATSGWFAAAGRGTAEVAHLTIGLSSVLCGALFVPIAWATAGDLLRREKAAGGADGAAHVLAFAVLAGQGALQLYFGYVENYTFLALALAAYALASLRAMEGRAPLLLPAALLVFALALHLSAAVVAPSFLVVAARALRAPGRRLAALRDLALAAVLFAATHFALARLHPGYDWTAMLLALGRRTTDSTTSYGFHRFTFAQFMNQQVLIGPLGLFLLAPAAVAALVSRQWRDGRSVYLAAFFPGYVAASFIAGDSNLGVARNWDLLAPAGFVFTLAALGFALRADWEASARRRWLFVLALATLFHTVPWIALNTSAARTIERYKVLPLGLGRAQVMVGDWYYGRGQEDEAIEWYRRALDENPLQNHAHSQLGRIAMHRGRYDVAELAFRSALRSRPTMALYRFQLVDALVREGRLAPARGELDTLLVLAPDIAGYRAVSALLWAALGERPRAEADLEAASRLAPGDSLAAALRRAVESDTARAALRGWWPRLVRY